MDMTENKRFRMEMIKGATLPFVVDNSTARQRSDKITSYKTYETHRKEKCLELVDLLNDLDEEKKNLEKENKELKQQIRYSQIRTAILSGWLHDEGNLTLDKYKEILDYCYQEYRKERL